MPNIKTLPDTVLSTATIAAEDLEAGAVNAAALGSASVTNAKLANLARGSIKVGGAANLVTDVVAKADGKILVGDGTDLNSVPVTGDIALTNTGLTTIQAAAVDHTKASTAVGSNTLDVVLPLIATTGTTEVLVVVPYSGAVQGVRVAFLGALAANDTNFITFGIINKGQAHAGATQMLDQTATNSTTKVTGGLAITGYDKRTLATSGTPSNLAVAAGDVLTVQAVVTGTLAGTVAGGTVSLLITPTT